MSKIEVMSLTDTPDTSGSSVQKLLRMKQLGEVYALDGKLSTLVREISRSKSVVIMEI